MYVTGCHELPVGFCVRTAPLPYADASAVFVSAEPVHLVSSVLLSAFEKQSVEVLPKPTHFSLSAGL